VEIEFESLHLLALALVAVVIVIADHDGFSYFRGSKTTLNSNKIKRLHQLTWVGLIAMIVTGIGLVAEDPDVISEDGFPVKMLMVLALVVNGFLIGGLSHIATTTPYSQLSPRQKMTLLASGAVSASCWIGATVIGFFL